MSPEVQYKAVAEACGWKHFALWPYPNQPFAPKAVGYHSDVDEDRLNYPNPDGKSPMKWLAGVPDFLSDLNAMHEAERVAQYHVGDYCRMLSQIASDGKVDNMTQYNLLHATAPQRAEAFLRTVGRWKP